MSTTFHYKDGNLKWASWEPTERATVNVKYWDNTNSVIEIVFGGDDPEIVVAVYAPLLKDLHAQITAILAQWEDKETAA